MPRYTVYLETDKGTTLAHVAGLPGCTVRASSREAVLAALPAAIRDHSGWLRRHGEPAPSPGEPIELDVAAEVTGTGPFNPGDAAALFPPDREPLTRAEMEDYFRLMAAARADLLALVRHLPDDLLDWEPGPGDFSIRRILRHVGNAEEWYVSRLVAPDTLPAEWEHDAELSLLEFLDMERRTAVERLRRLTDEERAAVLTPAQWTRHPDEEWTARKALRRAVEHEREHTGQVRAVLEARRAGLLATLAAARGTLVAAISALDARSPVDTGSAREAGAHPLDGSPDGWTVKDLIAHLAAWDRWAVSEMAGLAAGRPPNVEGADDPDEFNAAAVAAWRDRSLPAAVIEMHAARSEMIAWLEAVPVEALFRVYHFHGDDWYLPDWLRIYWEHDAEHAEQLMLDR